MSSNLLNQDFFYPMNLAGANIQMSVSSMCCFFLIRHDKKNGSLPILRPFVFKVKSVTKTQLHFKIFMLYQFSEDWPSFDRSCFLHTGLFLSTKA